MLVDIVQLPRRLKDFRHEASITSEQVLGYPMSYLHREFGYWSPNDEDFLGIGGKHRLIVGRDAFFRYKFIEPTKMGLAEYFVMASSPIDIRSPLRNKRIQLYCPWVTITDPRTLRMRKFLIWNGIFELMHYETEDSIHDVPIEAVIINEIRNQAILHDRPDILKGFESYPKDWKNVLISEEKFDGTDAAEMLTTLESNIQAYNEITVNEEPYYWPNIWDIFRDINIPPVWTDAKPLSFCTFLTHVIHGSTTMGEIRHLFGLNYDSHAFQRYFNSQALSPYTELSIYDDSNPDLFGILKLVERVPFSEFKLDIDEAGIHPYVYNPYDVFMRIDQASVKIDQEVMHKLPQAIKHYCSNVKKAEIIRSWGEEVYITIQHQDGAIERFFFDLISASIGTRSLIRDYNGRLF